MLKIPFTSLIVFLVVKQILLSLDELIHTVVLYSLFPVVPVAASIKPVIVLVLVESTDAPVEL